jgi:hypothetical protein
MEDQVHINRVTIREIMPRVCANRKICPVSVTRSVMDEQNGHKMTIGEYLLQSGDQPATLLA